MATISSIEEMQIWQLAKKQFLSIHRLMPADEFDQRRQILRSSASVMDNIAEGFGRGGRKEFKSFLVIAKGSNAEVKSQLLRCADINEELFASLRVLIEENDLLGKKIGALIKYLNASNLLGPSYFQP